jgi:hypothetical protein
MEFLDYKQEIERIVERKAKHLGKDFNLNLEKMFEAYINDVNPIDFIRSSISLNESSQNNEFSKYYDRIVKNIRTFGYNIIKMPRELMESVVNFYNEGYNTMVPTNYCLEQLKKNTIKVDKEKTDNILLKNQLLLLVHNIDNCALKGVEVTKTDAYAILKIKIFEMRNEINTDIKSYIKQLNKYFAMNQMPIITSRYWNMVHGATPDDVRKDEEGMQIMRILGKNMAYYLKCQEDGRKAGVNMPESEQITFTNFIR